MNNYSDALLQQQTVESCLVFLENLFEQHRLYFGHGTDNAWDEAVQLVLWCLNLPADSDDSVLSRDLTQSDREAILRAVSKRLDQRIPLPYITNQAWFMGLPFYVDERVLIPRSPFAELIKAQFSPWMPAPAIRRVLEIGTGSACMAIAVALTFPEVEVIATDIDANALQVAETNIQQYDLTERVQLLQSDVFDQVTGQFDLIISNPPYVPDEEMSSLPAEYSAEPDRALRADQQGLAVVEKIVAEASDFLLDHGILIVEVGNTDEIVDQQYADLPLTWLSFSDGGHGVFLISKTDLIKRG